MCVCLCVLVCVCVSVTLGLSQLFPSCGLCSLWGHSTYASLSISGDCHLFEVSPSSLLGGGHRFRCCGGPVDSRGVDLG